MTEQTVPPQNNPSQNRRDAEDLLKEFGNMAADWAVFLGKTAEDLTGLMVVRADSDLRSKLDVLVNSGAVRNRAEAWKMLVQSGIEKRSKIYEKVEQTEAQITELKNQLRGLAGNS